MINCWLMVVLYCVWIWKERKKLPAISAYDDNDGDEWSEVKKIICTGSDAIAFPERTQYFFFQACSYSTFVPIHCYRLLLSFRLIYLRMYQRILGIDKYNYVFMMSRRL